MKKILLLILFAAIIFGGYLIYNNKKEDTIKVLEIEEKFISINELYIYGTHLNMVGAELPQEKLELVLYNGKFLPIEIIEKDNSFTLSEYVNDGYSLENLDNGTYYLFLRNKYLVNEKENYKYYALTNKTDYKETTYYTLSNKNKKITIKEEDTYPTISVIVEDNKEEEIYDVVLDPGHGGRDPGATRYGSSETDFTLKLAEKVKAKLEQNNIKVKLTREEGTIKENEKLPEYGTHGRAVIPGETKAKYLFSFHFNSNAASSVNGLEIYTAAHINYDYARYLVNTITAGTGLNKSNNKINQVEDGIYTREFTNAEVNESIKSYEEEKQIPYNISTKSNYYYIIRETGGIVTGAYVDNRNSETYYNPYVNSNVGTETYLLELGYMTSKNDLENIKTNIDKYADAIANGISALFLEELKTD